LRRAVTYLEVALHGLKREVGERVDLGALIAVLVEVVLRENVVKL